MSRRPAADRSLDVEPPESDQFSHPSDAEELDRACPSSSQTQSQDANHPGAKLLTPRSTASSAELLRASPPSAETRRRHGLPAEEMRSESPFAAGFEFPAGDVLETLLADRLRIEKARALDDAVLREVGALDGKVEVALRGDSLSDGLCVRATASIAPCETFLREQALFTFVTGDDVPAAVESSLSPDERKVFNALHDSCAGDTACRKSIMGVCITNALSIDSSRHAVLRVGSRVNHSCSPNAAFRFRDEPASASSSPGVDSPVSRSLASAGSESSLEREPERTAVAELYATRRISAGDEVFISYVDHSHPREQRQRWLRERYDFECNCEVCALTGDALETSDARRSDIWAADAFVQEALRRNDLHAALANAEQMLELLQLEPALATPHNLLRTEFDAGCLCFEMMRLDDADRWLRRALAHAQLAHGKESEAATEVRRKMGQVQTQRALMSLR